MRIRMNSQAVLVPLYDVSEMILIFDNQRPPVAPLGGKRC